MIEWYDNHPPKPGQIWTNTHSEKSILIRNKDEGDLWRYELLSEFRGPNVPGPYTYQVTEHDLLSKYILNYD